MLLLMIIHFVKQLKLLCDIFYIKKIVAIRCACDNMQTLRVFGNGMQFFLGFVI